MTKGIVRRIDELGRIVLPIELRKTLRIREGDPLEIICMDDGIVLRKRGALQDREGFCRAAAEALHRTLDKPVFVFDTQCIVTGAGGGAAEGEPTGEMTEAVRARRATTLTTERGEHVAVVPLVWHGELFGGVGIVGGTEEELRIGRVCCDFLSQYLS